MSALRFASLLAGTVAFLTASLGAASAGEGQLRLVPKNGQAGNQMFGAPQESLGELLAVTPRGGMLMSLSTEGPASTPRFGIDYASTALGLDFALFGNLTTGATDRFGVSAINPQFFGVRGPAALTDPTTAGTASEWQVGGRLDFGAFSVAADLAQSDDLRLGRALTDYGLGMSYAGADWSIGMRYVRSLAALDKAHADVADAVHLGGTLQLSGSVNLVGGVQYWDQTLANSFDADSSGRSALVFFGTQIRF
ncbi:MAG: porin [Pseudomonadota bacterium]|nr:porin [Pseudomonadota bacterium]